MYDLNHIPVGRMLLPFRLERRVIPSFSPPHATDILLLLLFFPPEYIYILIYKYINMHIQHGLPQSGGGVLYTIESNTTALSGEAALFTPGYEYCGAIPQSRQAKSTALYRDTAIYGDTALYGNGDMGDPCCCM